MTTIPGSGASAGATNTPNPGSGATGTVQAATGDLRAEALAAYIRFAINRWRQMNDPADPDGLSLDLEVSRYLTAMGYRLVSDDEATVERVGWAIMHALARVAGEDHETTKAAWSEVGRAAVRALREAGTDA